jgi:hypothetical protein
MPLQFVGDMNRLWPWAIRRLEVCHVLALIMLPCYQGVIMNGTCNAKSCNYFSMY